MVFAAARKVKHIITGLKAFASKHGKSQHGKSTPCQIQYKKDIMWLTNLGVSFYEPI